MKTKPRYLDLHTHTLYSDGLYQSPQQLVGTAAYNGIEILAKTDHDTLAGIPEARAEAEKLGVLLINGVEITTPKYHLLGLGFQQSNRFREFIGKSQDIQERVVEQRVQALRRIGLPITLEKVKVEFPESRLGKYNLLWTVLKDSACREYFTKVGLSLNPQDVARYFFGQGGVAIIDKLEPEISVEEAIREVHAANGIIGIAHPEKDIREVAELGTLVKQGIDFIEVQPNIRHLNPAKTKMVADFVRSKDMLVTYGSDYHGSTFGRKILDNHGENILSERLATALGIN
ncbi:PHP domain-containing protein [Candidatus Pacearchaeota archaeon]|nr:PHP domain-containing protein [Candidatus Pacearchaeota archaeon]